MDTVLVTSLLETLVTELERPRELPAQVVKHLGGTYEISRDAIGGFLADDLPKLEDYEIDLILSPVFTPTLHDQAVLAELLGGESVPPEQWPALIRQIVARPTHAQLTIDGGQAQSVTFREVTVERYVRRLRLDATIPEPILKLLSHLPPAADRPMLKAVARRAVWEKDARHKIFVLYITNAANGDSYRLDDAMELLKLVETYQPSDASDLLARIPRWQQVLRQEINAAGDPKPFFNDRVQELHGDRKSTRLNSSHPRLSRMPSSA